MQLDGGWPRYILACHYRSCDGLPWDTVREKVVSEVGNFPTSVNKLVNQGARQHKTWPVCGKPWERVQKEHMRPVYHRPRLD